jgi:hypothetical protein
VPLVLVARCESPRVRGLVIKREEGQQAALSPWLHLITRNIQRAILKYSVLCDITEALLVDTQHLEINDDSFP